MGRILAPQEIRMSLFYSKFYEMLFRINKYGAWRTVLGQKNVDLHYKDVEFLVRGYAMLFSHNEYKATMTKFLNRFSKNANNFDVEMVNYLDDLFRSFLESCNGLEEKSFYSQANKFSILIFEAVFVAVCEDSFLKKRYVVGRISQVSIDKLKNDSEFCDASKESVASAKNVKVRISRAKNLIELQ